jgi:hypothetical protein
LIYDLSVAIPSTKSRERMEPDLHPTNATVPRAGRFDPIKPWERCFGHNFQSCGSGAAFLPKKDADDKDRTSVCKMVMPECILRLIDSFLCQNRPDFG